MIIKCNIPVSTEMAQAMEECIHDRWAPATETGKLGTVECQLCSQARRERTLAPNYLRKICHYCPIYKVTGAKLCKKTPYEEWDKLNFLYFNEYSTYIYKHKKAAEAEVAFLKGVRDRMYVDPEIVAINYKTNEVTKRST
jgi:hypothetical protein